jgi:hypothetical protein
VVSVFAQRRRYRFLGNPEPVHGIEEINDPPHLVPDDPLDRKDATKILPELRMERRYHRHASLSGDPQRGSARAERRMGVEDGKVPTSQNRSEPEIEVREANAIGWTDDGRNRQKPDHAESFIVRMRGNPGRYHAGRTQYPLQPVGVVAHRHGHSVHDRGEAVYEQTDRRGMHAMFF